MKTGISVIVPVLNREKLICRSLDSIMGQTRKPQELIVVDNGSTDQTVKVVENWISRNQNKGVKIVLLNAEKRGAIYARQKGLEYSTGDYLIFFDSDDEMLPDLIKKASCVAEDDLNTDIVCWKCRINLLNGSIHVPPFNSQNPLEYHLIHAQLRTQGYMVKRSFLINAEGWTKEIMVWNDFELGLRILLKNPVIKGINEILVQIYSQEDSITGVDFSSKEGQWEYTLDEMEKILEQTNHKDKNRIRKILNYRRAILAAHYFREGNRIGAEKLMERTKTGLGAKERRILSFSYNLTRKGIRGAWRIVRYFI